MKSVKRIGIFGHYGNRNLGDEAIIQAVMQNLKKRLPKAELVGFSLNPEDTASRHGVEAFPIRRRSPHSKMASAKKDDAAPGQVSSAATDSFVDRAKARIKKIPLLRSLARLCLSVLAALKSFFLEVRFLFHAFQYMKSIDVLIVTGSNQLLDNFGGPWGFPYTLLKWALLTRLVRARLLFVSVGAGPIAGTLSCRFLRWALHFADYVSLRDYSSQQLLREQVGFKGKTHVAPDLAHSLLTEQVKPTCLPESRRLTGLPVVGINPMPLFDPRYWCEPVDSKYKQYIGKVADFSQKLLANEYPLFFFPTQEKDQGVIVDILDILQKRGVLSAPREDYVLTSDSVDDLLANIAACDITVPTRFHGTVLSLLLEKPTLGICYYQKAKELLSVAGQAEFAYDHEQFQAEDLWCGFTKLVGDIDHVKEQIRHRNSEHTIALERQYFEIIELIE